MRGYPEKFGNFLRKLSGGFGASAGDSASGPNSKKIGNWGYVAIVVLTLTSSVSIYLFAPNTGWWALPLILGLGLGSGILLYLPGRLLITIFAFTVGLGSGTSAAGADDVAGIFDKLMSSITKISNSLNQIGGADMQVKPISLLIFIFVVLLFCIPAYNE